MDDDYGFYEDPAELLEPHLLILEVEYTGAEDFRNRHDIVRVRVAPNVAKIEDGAFCGCTNLREVDLGNVTAIGAEAFRDCHSLAWILLPPTVAGIGIQAFSACRSLVKVELCDGLQIIEGGAFEECSYLEHAHLPSTVIEIGACAFSGCEALREVVLPEGAQKIGRWAFRGCTLLVNVTVQSNFTRISSGAFRDCRSLWAVQFCEGIHHIASDSFTDGCESLRSIDVPPNSFLIECGRWGESPSCRLLSNSIIPSDNRYVERTLVSGKFGGTIVQVEETIKAMIRHQDGTMEERAEMLRDMVAHFRMKDATTCLELAIRKADVEAPNAESIVVERVLPFLKSGNKWAFL